ncbi:hypothetical protein HXX25_01775 [Hyphobacterium sp. CCMP332]|uniref:hypothetical protein n=1 Tax=Hyphobacterium sp. CCMP332 TaxID=2749086 RepID=UPI0016506C3D|nr:hypothetical protein [Hyphobacterium sp. CCMP332]QNL18175.1 hypothetical protein HXX25_01775 [Hyphobacterium sp. CCMP332]
MNRPDRAAIHKAMKDKGYVIFGNSKGFDLNIVGIRSAETKANAFDDWLTVSYKDAAHGDWAFYAFACTTDPGLSHLQNLSHPDGTAVLKEGQYRSSHMIRKHQGQYDAICQKPGYTLQTYRDRNMDGTIDRDSDRIFNNATGINIHRASRTRRSTQVDRWSAGCTVIADPTDFDVVMTLARRAKEIYGNGFTYTLLNEADL